MERSGAHPNVSEVNQSGVRKSVDHKLLYGKGERNWHSIVSIEIKDDIATFYHQDEDGSVYKTLNGNKFWILSHEARNSWHRLKGNNYYQYGRQFESREDFQRARQALKKTNDIYSIYDPRESFQVLKGYTYYRGLKPKDISILSFDLETTGLLFNKDSKILLISNTFRKNAKIYSVDEENDPVYTDNYVIEKKLFCYDDYEDEGEMLKAWCDWVRNMDPSIITGHNINSFDLHYLNFIARRFDIELNLGRDGSPLKIENCESKFRKDGSQDLHYRKSHIYGREIVDTLFLATRYDVVAKKHPTYGLKAVIAAEGLQRSDRTFYDASQIRNNYKIPAEWEKIKEYCKDDSDDALALFDLMAPAQFYLANSIPKPFQLITESATGSQLNSFLVRSYLQEGHSIPKASQLSPVKGGISFGIPGIYSNVFKIDLKSAYPSQILRFKLFDPFKDPEGNFYKMVEHFTHERFEFKKKYEKTKEKHYDDRSQSGKIFINSAYGMLNTTGLNFNNSNIAEKITYETRQTIEQALQWASNKGMDFYKQYMKEEENEEIANN